MFREFDTFKIENISLNKNIHASCICFYVFLLMLVAGIVSKEIAFNALCMLFVGNFSKIKVTVTRH